MLSRLAKTCWIAAAGLAVCFTSPRAGALPPGLVDELVIDRWNQITGVVFAPDGRGFVWEKAGQIWIVENGSVLMQPLLDIREEVRNYGDHGLLGVALDPNFMTNGRIYLLYSVDYYYLTHYGQPDYNPFASEYERDSIGRVTRYTVNTNTFHSVVQGSRKILVGETKSTGFPHCFDSHSIGTIAFGEDGSLFAGCGDSASWAEADNGGPRQGSSNTALADGIITPKEDVGAFRAQLVDSLGGKIVRIDPETGDGIPGNPFYDAAAPRAPRSRVWAMGFRNPFRFSVKPGSATPQNPAGSLYVGDVGWYSFEEINIVSQGGQNFGWPLFEGGGEAPEYPALAPQNQDAPNPLGGQGGCPSPYFSFADMITQDTLGTPSWPNPCNPAVQVPANLPHFMHTRPILQWGHGHPVMAPIYDGIDASLIDVTDPASPVHCYFFWGDTAVGGVWCTGDSLGLPYKNTYFMGDFVGGFIKNFVFDEEDGDLHEVNDFQNDAGAVVYMTINPKDGALYYISYGYTGESVLRRIRPSDNLPPTVKTQSSVQYGASPLGVQFTSEGTFDPEGRSLLYSWDFGDGSPPSSLAAPFHVFTAPGSGPARFDVTLTVTDDGNNSVQSKLFVSPNNTPPRVTITSPIDGMSMVVVGEEQVPLQSINDDDETPGQLSCTWQALLHHNTHTHPEAPINQCESSVGVGPHGTAGDTAYVEFQLTVTDPQGLSTTKAVSVFPLRCDADAPSEVPSATTCPSSPAYLWTTPAGAGPFIYQWQREVIPDTGLFVPLGDGPTSAWGGGAAIEGSATDTLAIVPSPGILPADAVRYRCIVTTGCGSVVSAPGKLDLCAADFDCSGFVDLEDFIAFVMAFEAGDQSADADGSGFVDTDDYDAFVRSFEVGC